MKLATFTYQGHTRIGAVIGNEIVDTMAIPAFSNNMIALLEGGSQQLEALQNLIQQGHARLPLTEVKLEAPIQKPPKILAIGLNYSDHIEETGRDQPEYPTFFNKQRTAINGPYDAIHKPRVSDKLDYEGELGFVIARRCRHVPKEEAHNVIGGYIIVNDVSVRDWQQHSPTFTMGKSFDTHCPIGPWIVTPDELGDPHNLELKTWVSGQLRQSSNTRHMIFNCYDQIAYLSTAFTLEPGDIISTGTCSGVGVKMKPRGYMKCGDTVRVEIEKIGYIENPVIEEPDTACR
jgi:2-keto-4-pentenoate hydratase/2-oxohepta-3-ene-1,7-dioic acid hydratase in catechol pathway